MYWPNPVDEIQNCDVDLLTFVDPTSNKFQFKAVKVEEINKLMQKS